jgi:hypothetical protein
MMGVQRRNRAWISGFIVREHRLLGMGLAGGSGQGSNHGKYDGIDW